MTPEPTLPNLVVVGAMKCATSALHEYLDTHPDIAMSRTKELNFFNGPERAPHDDRDSWWVTGQWHRGVDWYASQFDPGAPVRGESSPAYTSPSFPEVAGRMATLVPGARLVYLVRDPVQRAVSQYEHHRRDGTEDRPLEEAILDPASQYLGRSRYHERLLPFLEHFDRQQIHVVLQERLLQDRRAELARVFGHAGVDPEWYDDRLEQRFHVGSEPPAVGPALREAFLTDVRDDVERLRDLTDDELEEWDLP